MMGFSEGCFSIGSNLVAGISDIPKIGWMCLPIQGYCPAYGGIGALYRELLASLTQQFFRVKLSCGLVFVW